MDSHRSLPVFAVLFLLSPFTVSGALEKASHPPTTISYMTTIRFFSSLGDRSTGTPGFYRAAEYIRERFIQLGLDTVSSQRFSVPVRKHNGSELILPDRMKHFPIHPLSSNAISPETISPRGLEGPLLYAGAGDLRDYNGKIVEGAIVLMELSSGKNWINAADLGAKALIYIDRGPTSKVFFEEKFELSPIRFPRFWIPFQKAREMFGPFEDAPGGRVASTARLRSKIRWQPAAAENIYGLISGEDARLKEELIVVDAFYDSTALVPGQSPGADEACSLATLLELASFLKTHPPARSVLLVATAGHAQTLSGMRELIWSLNSRSKDLKKIKEELTRSVKESLGIIEGLDRMVLDPSSASPFESDQATGDLVRSALTERIKTETDSISRQLMALRMARQNRADRVEIMGLARKRLELRRLGWRSTFADLNADERLIMNQLLPAAREDHMAILKDAEHQLALLKSTRRFRSQVKEMTVAAVISLHLSSHGDGYGAFNRGFLYDLKPRVNRVAAYRRINDVMQAAATEVNPSTGQRYLYKDTLRPSRLRSWQSYLLDRPNLGGEVSALAGYLGLSLVTVDDARPFWGTPYDLPELIQWDYAVRQNNHVHHMIRSLTSAPVLHARRLPTNGFSTVSGQANFLRYGELFADLPASEMVILGYQGSGRYYGMTDSRGMFRIKGVANKKHVAEKVILEGYRFDPDTGTPIWAIDKKQTGKPAYRLSIRRNRIETRLVAFACREMTFFNLLEPRSFRYMTKIQLFDARRDTRPLRYWYSRIDTRSSIINSIYLEAGTPLKLTLSDTILRKKMILTNASDSRPEGVGYLVDTSPMLNRTTHKVARDMWTLLEPRIKNLEDHGIFDERIGQLQNDGMSALHRAEAALADRKYDRFSEAASASWALASRVYNHVEKIQKDVLYGVLFYVALFVPFAYCLERLLFSYINIYKRIAAFCGILVSLIAVIYNVHPAFQLAYSPMVVILAFFIMGLSFLVTLIIFFRFEEEMILLQHRAKSQMTGEISRWKAFVAAFILGVSNLRRRRLRTALTCVTLIILTFTIMSFTSVKSLRSHGRLFYQEGAPYQGFLFKNANWQDLPTEALSTVSNAFEQDRVVAPRVWFESEDRTRSPRVPIRSDNREFMAQGLIGLSAEEVHVSSLAKILTSGRWFKPNETYGVLLPERMATALGVDSKGPGGVSLWGMPFDVVGVFSGKAFSAYKDLDGEPLTPVTFPGEHSMALTEVEMEALASGEDMQAFQSRYHHIEGDLTVIVPYQTLLALGGHLKGVAVRPKTGSDFRAAAEKLVDRFGLLLFGGEPDGTFMYHASDTLRYSGIPNILIPILISILIVLNTMVGSVYERKREIASYTSVGLAPSHVAFLFIAEAMAFAVLSVVLGYLLAQTTAGLFAESSLWAGITVNYSSLAGVAAMVLVMLVVIVSAIYPARVAASIAIPDVTRSWKLPESDGNRLEVTLPFLMKHNEHRSIGGYLFDHFEEHQDVSHGSFSTGDIACEFVCPASSGIFKDTPDCYGNAECGNVCLKLHSKVWLSPFDLGIMQEVEILFCPATVEPGFLNIEIRIIRKSGEMNAWRRINRSFLLGIRKQLLIWRSLDTTVQERFTRLLASALDSPCLGKEMRLQKQPAYERG